MKLFYVAIVGSRRYPQLGTAALAVDALRRRLWGTGYDLKVVTGGAPGIDRVAEKTARKLFPYPPLIFKPDYTQFGRYRAPHIRNGLIAEYCDCMIAIHDGESPGTKSAMGWAALYDRPVLLLTPHDVDCEPKIRAWDALPPVLENRVRPARTQAELDALDAETNRLFYS